MVGLLGGQRVQAFLGQRLRQPARVIQQVAQGDRAQAASGAAEKFTAGTDRPNVGLWRLGHFLLLKVAIAVPAGALARRCS